MAAATSDAQASPKKKRVIPCSTQSAVETVERLMDDAFRPPSLASYSKPIRSGPDGKGPILTFSTDTEIPLSDFFRLIRRHPEVETSLRRELPAVTRETLIRVLDVSDKKFAAFALRKEVDSNLKEYSLLDLNPAYAEKARSLIPGFLDRIKKNNPLVKHGNQALQLENKNLELGVDGVELEFRHLKYETNPSRFSETMKEIESRFQHAQAHMHLGLPVEVYSWPEAEAIARAIETQVVLDMIADTPKIFVSLPYPHGSPLSHNYNRGPVYIDDSRMYFFTKPTEAYNLELRQYYGMADGLDKMAAAVYLAKNRAHLRISPQRFQGTLNGANTSSYYFGNLVGALQYAEFMLGSSTKPLYRDMAKQIRKFLKVNGTDFVKQEKYYSAAHQFVRKFKLDQIMKDPKIFLTESVTPVTK